MNEKDIRVRFGLNVAEPGQDGEWINFVQREDGTIDRIGDFKFAKGEWVPKGRNESQSTKVTLEEMFAELGAGKNWSVNSFGYANLAEAEQAAELVRAKFPGKHFRIKESEQNPGTYDVKSFTLGSGFSLANFQLPESLLPKKAS